MTTTIATGNALTNKAWGQDVFMDSVGETFMFKYMGKSPNSMIRLLTETQKGKGDTITVPYVGLLTGLGKTENETLYGNEETSTYYNDALTINELWNATEVRGKGTIDPQRVPFDMRQIGKDLLKDWFRERYDVALFRQLCGYAPTAAESSKLTLFNTPTAPSTGDKVYPAAITTDEGCTSTNIFSFSLIDKALLRAKVRAPKIQPLVVGGKRYFNVFLHPYQVKDLQTDTTVGNWFDVQGKAMQGGKIEDNPIFTGALGIYKGCILHESDYITTGLDSTLGTEVTTTWRAVLAGANAAAVAFGDEYGDKQMAWREELKDYQRLLGIGAGIVCGAKKLRFNSKDNGVIVMSSYGA